jgi:hypothetical protein
MPRGHISIGTDGYMLVPFEMDGETKLIHKRQLAPYGDSFRLEGGGTQKAITERESRVFLPPTGGMLLKRISSDQDESSAPFRRAYDMAGVDTRWPAEVRLSILKQESTDPANSEVARASATFKGNLYSFWDRHDGSNHGANYARFTNSGSNTWNTTTGLASASIGEETVLLDAIAHKTSLVALVAADVHQYSYNSTNGTTWSVATTDITVGLLAPGSPAGITANEDIDAGLFATVGTELVVAIWHEVASTITFFSSTDSGDTWVDEGLEIPSANGPQGVAVMTDADSTDKLWVGTHEGIHAVDTSVSTWTSELVFPMTESNGNGKRMTVHQGRIYFAHGVSDNEPAPISSIHIEGSQRIVTNGLGFNVGDGVPEEMLGPVRWMKSAGDMLFISMGGGAVGRNARIMCGLAAGGGLAWHTMFRNVANQKIEWIDISTAPDGLPRLFFGRRVSSSDTDVGFLLYPTTNPQSLAAGTIKTVATGYIDYPYTDYGMPTIEGAVLQGRVAAGAPSGSVFNSSNEYVNLDYGVNDTAFGSFTDLGDITDSVPLLDFASGAGVEMSEVAIRVNLVRDGTDTTDTPVFRSLEVVSLKHIDRRYEHIMMVDIEATAVANAGLNTEDVIANLEAAENLKTLPILEYGNTGSIYVRIDFPQIGMSLSDLSAGSPATASDPQARRKGNILVRAKEIT